MEWLIISVYGLTLLIICLFSLGQFNLAWHYLKSKKICEDELVELSEYPMVTIQLPIFNEKYVVERLINNIIALDYPKDRLEIQVLDDSTDNTLEISRKKVDEYKKLGYQIELVHRIDRDTSGCLLIAKRRTYLIHFQNQLRHRKMNKEYFGSYVHSKRISQEKSLRDFCIDLEFDPVYWSQVERFKEIPPKDEDSLVKIGEYLDLDIAEFIELVDEFERLFRSILHT